MALAAACGGGNGPDGGTPSPSDAASPTLRLRREAENEIGGVRVHVSVEKEQFGEDDRIVVRAEAENEGDEPAVYTSQRPDQTGFDLVLTSEVTGEQTLATPEQREGELSPDEKLTIEAEWDKRLEVTQSPIPAPSGTYTVTAYFRTLDRQTGEPLDIAAAITFEYEGPDIVTPEEAIQKALTDEAAKAWGLEKAASVACTVSGVPRYWLADFQAGTVEETKRDAYEVRLQLGGPICGLTTVDDDWQVAFLAPQAEEPKRYSVRVDVLTGEVESSSAGTQATPPSGSENVD
jgi:hypothetical protein